MLFILRSRDFQHPPNPVTLPVSWVSVKGTTASQSKHLGDTFDSSITPPLTSHPSATHWLRYPFCCRPRPTPTVSVPLETRWRQPPSLVFLIPCHSRATKQPQETLKYGNQNPSLPCKILQWLRGELIRTKLTSGPWGSTLIRPFTISHAPSRLHSSSPCSSLSLSNPGQQVLARWFCTSCSLHPWNALNNHFQIRVKHSRSNIPSKFCVL